jgi:glyoxylase-like metal-dependent hydrolase (beta-lactamase superfamily II)
VFSRFVVLTSVVVVGASLSMAAAQRGPRIPPTGAIFRVKDNLYVIPGAGGNTTVFVTTSGVVLVDTKLANNGEPILKQVQAITDKPVTTIINTHAHPDHNGSNDYFKATRPTIEVVTHENTKKWVESSPRSNLAMKPDRTFSDKTTLGQGRDRIDLYYFGAAHTSGDAFVVFPAVRTMCVGDVMAWKMAPLIDPATGGSVIALPDTLDRVLGGITNVDTVIEGHGDANTWAGLRDYARFNRALLNAAKAGLGTQTAQEVAATLKAAFPVFTKEELLPGLEYGGTPLSRAVINVNVAFQELRGEPVTTNFGAPPPASTPPPAR